MIGTVYHQRTNFWRPTLSSKSALIQAVLESPRPGGSPAIDLCGPIYLRNYALHQAAQESINHDWMGLLQVNS